MGNVKEDSTHHFNACETILIVTEWTCKKYLGIVILHYIVGCFQSSERVLEGKFSDWKHLHEGLQKRNYYLRDDGDVMNIIIFSREWRKTIWLYYR